MPKLIDDPARIDEAALGLLYLTLHDHDRAWKGLDWDVLGRLHAAGMIHDPVGKVKSVVFTEEGLKAAEAAWEKLFAKESWRGGCPRPAMAGYGITRPRRSEPG